MACYSLALLYKEGKGVDASLPEALYYARKAIVQGGVIAEPLEREILEELRHERGKWGRSSPIFSKENSR